MHNATNVSPTDLVLKKKNKPTDSVPISFFQTKVAGQNHRQPLIRYKTKPNVF